MNGKRRTGGGKARVTLVGAAPAVPRRKVRMGIKRRKGGRHLPA